MMVRSICLCILLSLGVANIAAASDETLFNPDVETDRLIWSAMDRVLGQLPDAAGRSYGIVVKTPVNEYWRLMTEGYRSRAARDKVSVDIQAAQNEQDVTRQLALMHTMLGNRYDAILISPISTENLKPAIDDALSYGIPVIDVDGAAVGNVQYFVGPMNAEMGKNAAQWFIDNKAGGGKIAIIKGKEGLLSTVERSNGFKRALSDHPKFVVVAAATADWDASKARAMTIDILKRHPDLIGIYCNNDTMALAAAEAVKQSERAGQVAVIGSDGTKAAYDAIRNGDLTATVDIFPWLTGWIGLEVAQRISLGQTLPKVIETPQALVTRDNIAVYDVPHPDLLTLLSKDR